LTNSPQFSDQQLDVINLNRGWHACLAPAGSGKTMILSERVSRAIEEGIEPAEMLCLTFTNRAARSMVDRVKGNLGERAEGVFIGNTHAFALRMLARNRLIPASSALADDQTINYLWSRAISQEVLQLLTQSPEKVEDCVSKALKKIWPLDVAISPLSSSQLASATRRITANKFYDRWSLKALCSLVQPLLEVENEQLEKEFLEYVRNRLFVIDENIRETELPLALGLALIAFEHYNQSKQSLHLYDFDDLLVKAWKTLASGIPEKMSNYSWCQIDEVQDLSPVQWLIINNLLAANSHVLLFGDINQSIYRFLGASIEVTEHNLGNSQFKLTKNYRSPANLVEMADKYCNKHFQKKLKTEANKPARDAALVHVNRPIPAELDRVLIKHAKKLITHDSRVSVAFLCPTNNQVGEYSKKLRQEGLDHFRINSQDLFSSELGLDFFAFLNALYEPKNRLAWARLVWRFGDLNRMTPEERKGDEPQLAAMRLAADLGVLGCELHDFLGEASSSSYFLRQFCADTSGEITYFDTETTGLDPKVNAIIQIAGVRMSPGQVSTEVDLYCQTDQPLGASVDIHHITKEVLAEKGKHIKKQLKHFLLFAQDTVLVAHNLPFDDAMLRSQLLRWAPYALSSYEKMRAYCTLDISRRLYPNLPKHKLGILLEEFGLEGANSHNALDDVKAGANLLDHLAEEVKLRLDSIDRVINPYAVTIERFSRRFTPLWEKADTLKKCGGLTDLPMLLGMYFSYAEHFKQYDTNDRAEFEKKLNGHAKVNFPPAPLSDFLSNCVPFYQTAKEADLITDYDSLVVSTIHRAKGLEFDYVILPGMVDGVIPGFWINERLGNGSPKAQEEAKKLLDEQKRLLYVALTRAKDQLVIGSYNNDRGREKKVSPFLMPVLNMFKRA
jgi:DNA helicase-2/ATP-dependent DNA helicase PcrA